ncbi:MAG: hypothetical protein ACR5LA_10445 [Wolbachia sp.]
MKNVFNKTNAPYLVAGALATLALVSSGVVGVLTAVAVFNASLPLIAGLVSLAVFSAATIALSAVAISKNKTVSQQEKFESRVAQRKQEEENGRAELKIPGIIELPYKDAEVSSPENEPAKDANAKISDLRKKVANGAKLECIPELSDFLSREKLETVKQLLREQANREKNVATQQNSSDPNKDAEVSSPENQLAQAKEVIETENEEVLDSEALIPILIVGHANRRHCRVA